MGRSIVVAMLFLILLFGSAAVADSVLFYYSINNPSYKIFDGGDIKPPTDYRSVLENKLNFYL